MRLETLLRSSWAIAPLALLTAFGVVSATQTNAAQHVPHGPGLVAGTPTDAAVTIQAPKRIVPHRPFIVTVTTSSGGVLTIGAQRTRKLKTLTSRTVTAGTHRIQVATKWLNVKSLAATLVSGSASTATSRPVTTKRKAYPVIDPISKEQLGSSWQTGCPVRIRDMRVLEISHVNYRGRVKRGRIVVHVSALKVIKKVLTRAFKKDFRIKKMVPVDHYGGSDDLSMRDDNTSAFMCRPLPSGWWSRHAYGDAIDINPRRNPHLLTPLAPTNAKRYVDRSPLRRGMIGSDSVVTRVFLRNGWGWGARYRSPDYQHFSSTGG